MTLPYFVFSGTGKQLLRSVDKTGRHCVPARMKREKNGGRQGSNYIPGFSGKRTGKRNNDFPPEHAVSIK
jgi:hypothetical protein